MRSIARRPLTTFVRLASALALLALLLGALPGSTPRATASGSREIVDGWRPYIEWHETATSAGIPRRTTISAYAEPGEAIYLGSSAMGLGQGNVRYRGPGGVTGNCVADGTGIADFGRILNRTQENNGPRTAAQPAGYIPCIIPSTDITAPGIWEFDFISPFPTAPLNNDPIPARFNDAWVQDQDGRDEFWTAAWEVSVRDAATEAEVTGRVFANYISFNLGTNVNPNPAVGRTDVGLDTTFYILTIDGYGYEVDTNGIDPFGFIFFANSEGITDVRGNPIYRSVQLVGVPSAIDLPPGFSLHRPDNPDDAAQNNITHKIFFEEPDPALPADAVGPDGSTWLLRTPVNPPTATNVRFVGQEGTPGQAGTNPLTGVFTFDAPANTAFTLTIDTNGSGTYGDTTAAGTDRTLSGTTSPNSTSVSWDGLDGAGAKVPASTVGYSARVLLYAGEVHFPFIDAENNPSGLILERFRDPTPAVEPDSFTIYWNDSYTYDPGTAYDYSLCASGQTPAPPAAAIGARPQDPVCYGTPIGPRSAILGADSQAGAHSWTYVASVAEGPSRGFGDRRLMDTWAYFPSQSPAVIGSLVLAEADLSISKASAPNPLRPGDGLTYTVIVTNNGPSPVTGARVTDDVPAAVLGVTWQCVASAGGSCAQASGSGNLIDTTVNLPPLGTATFSIQGTLSTSAAGSLENTASVRRPNDVTDPDLNNNTARNITPIIQSADLELTKTVTSPPASIVTGGLVDFTIELRNRGPSTATNVAVTDRLPAGLTFDSATASQGGYVSATGVWTVGTLPSGGVARLTITARWNGSAVTNTAQVSASDQPDPDSTPNNNVPTEDDQSSAQLPLQIADLEVEKTVSAPQVNVGANATFTVRVTNTGPATATGVRLSDRLPAGLSLVSATASQGSYDAVSGQWTVGSLANGASATLNVVVTLLGVGPYTNIAQVSASDQYDPDSTPNNDDPTEDDQAPATIRGALADLSLSKTVDDTQPPFNGRITYTVRVLNDGPSPATGVAVTDRLPAGLAFVGATPSQGSYDSATGLWTVGSLAVGGAATLTIQANVTSGAPIVNTAQVSASDQPDPDSSPGNNVPSEDDQASVTLTPQLADLRLSKTVDNAAPPVGGEVNYEITLVNDGPNRATGVAVSERLPAGLIYVAHTASQGSYDTTTGEWTVGALDVGATATLGMRVRLSGIGPYTNTAQVSKSDQFDPDSTPNNGIGNNEDDQDSVTIGAVLADLSVSKAAEPLTVPANGEVIYTIGVRNDGPSPATGVAVGEQLPPGAVLLGTTPSQGSYDTATNTWNVGGLNVGAAATLQVRVGLSGAARYENVAQVTASDQPDPDSTPGNNVASEDDYARAVVLGPGPLPPQADLRVEKVALRVDKLANGVAYVVRVFNDGPNVATGVEVTDKLPAGVSYISSSPSQGSYNPLSGQWVVGTLAVGGSASLTILATYTDITSVTNTAQVSKSDLPDPDSTPNNNDPTEDDQASVTGLTAIELLELTAARTAGGVLVRWTTGAERDTAGFHLYRAAGDAGRAAAVRVTARLVVARGGAASGASYEFVDAGAAPGVTYRYWLVEIERDGDQIEYGPASTAPAATEQFYLYLPALRR